MRPLLFVLIATLTGCGGALISAKQERELGEGVHQEIIKQYKILHKDDPVTKWARQVIAPLAKASKKFRDPAPFGGYKLSVIHDPKLVNAFAAPGGFTYLSTGLVLKAETCSEIAGVLGHELAHVTQRHGVKAMEQQMAASTLGEMFLGEGLAKDAAIMALNILQGTKFSREHEAESDKVGLQIAHDANYNPYGLASFFTKLMAQEKASGGAPPEFLSSHPATSKRVASVKAQIKQRYGSVKTKDAKRDRCQGTDLTLAQVKQRIKAKQLRFADTSAPAQAPKPGTKTGNKKP